MKKDRNAPSGARGVSAEELAQNARCGDSSAFEEIARRYEGAIRAISASFAVPESERDDLYQEGLIALYRAVCRYDGSIASFSTFARVCIKRAMISWVRRTDEETRSLSLDGESPWEDRLSDLLPADESEGPEEAYLTKEFCAEMRRRAMRKLSDYEKCVFLLYLEDVGAAEIARMLGKPKKSVENALLRIRKKLSEDASV